ncbi:magnesium transporter [Amphiplicatus metriothermophilus]|uniref:Magnesium transporter MgtE n=1 Tax=Amphiplicatus metriothermophilus TaxID=1519374 RepID=A0A239PXG2_9PROT|nr:magnesium transporter [Amphiplicatus metriothermophilus]MBB5519082.1 magnesium transporter [Amphiplicatus metriothermophilus]SNT74778.1 magnesium transporter [Amphiplicatus metriothermophilus]
MSEPRAADETARAPEGAPTPPAGEEAEIPPFGADRALSEGFVDSVAAAIEAADAEQLHALCDELHPADMADLLGLLHEDERVRLIELLGGGLPAETLAELDSDIRESVVLALKPEKLAEAVADLDTDDAAFVLEDLDEEKRAEILAEIPVPDRIALHQALDYEEESAGRLMQREVFAAPAYWTVGQIIDRLRGSDDLPDRFYEVFVVDPTFKPVGSVPLSTLLKTPREVPISQIMSDRELRLIPVTMDQEEVAYLFEQYNLISAPVVDESERLVGMITVDDVVEIVHEETHEDMLAMTGVAAESGLSDSVIETARFRVPWLVVNLFTAMLAGSVVGAFGATIEQIVVLAALMPVIAGMGGNAGTQTLAVTVRALATKTLTFSNAARVVMREAGVGLVNGLVFGVLLSLLAGGWSLFMSGDPDRSVKLALVTGSAMTINLVIAALAGILIPLGLHRLGADPAVASGIFLTTVTDVTGFFVFLGLATIVLL